ncbi:MAG: hypothetical protein AB1918_18815, partial [Pseudomonadota bacterium]
MDWGPVTLRRIALAVGYTAAVVGLAGLARPHFSDDIAYAPWNATAALAFGLVARKGLAWAWLALAAPFGAQILYGGDADTLLLRVIEAAIPIGAALVLRNAQANPPDLNRLRTVMTFFGLTAATAAGIAVAHALVAMAGAAAMPGVAALLAV